MIPTTHHPQSPSKFPAWALCPAFDSTEEEREDATEGTRQHAALSAILTGQPDPLAGLSPDAAATVTWAADYTRTLAGPDPIQSEQRVEYSAPDAFHPAGRSVVFHGTADAIVIRPPGNTADLIDFKSGGDDRDHQAQLAGYALALFSMRPRLKTIRGHVLYGRPRKVDTATFTPAEAARVVLPLLDARNAEERKPAACEYCPLCQHRAGCPALTAPALTVAEAQALTVADLVPLLRDPASITDPPTMARVLNMARTVSTWADAVRQAITEKARQGMAIPGHRLQERRTREVANVPEAMRRAGLPPDAFLQACKVSLPKLAEAVAFATGASKAQATRQLDAELSDIVNESVSVSLVADRKG